MVSDFRKKKLLRGFQFMDTDNSGSIEKSDFDQAFEKISKVRGWAPGSPKYKEAKDLSEKIWAGIQSKADSDKDGKVTVDEWLSMWDEYSKNPGSPMDFQNLYCKFVFSLLDKEDDGKIDADEFVGVVATFGKATKEEATAAFQKISNGKPSLTFEDYQVLWKEFYASEDPSAPANYIFGRAIV